MKEKIAELKKYELVLDAEIYTWDYIIDDVHRVGEIVRKQSEICEKFCQCLKDILTKLPEANGSLWQVYRGIWLHR